MPAVAPAEKPKIAVKGQGDERERSSSTVELAKACMERDSGVEDRQKNMKNALLQAACITYLNKYKFPT